MIKYVLAAFLFTIGLAEIYAQDDLQSISEQIKAQMDIEKNLFFTQVSGLHKTKLPTFGVCTTATRKKRPSCGRKAKS